MLRNFSWVLDGVLAGMALPTSAYGSSRKHDHADLERDLEELKRIGINAVVSLTRQPLHQPTLKRCGIVGTHVPVEDMTAPSMEQIRRCVEFVDKATATGGIVIHCSAGIGRTGTMLACYLVWKGWSAQNAISVVRQCRPGSIETVEQEWAVMDFADLEFSAGETRKTGTARSMPGQWNGVARVATSDELDEVINVCTAAFSARAGYDRRKDFERRIASDATGEFVKNRVLIVNDRIVSALRVYDRPVRIGRSLVRCAGVGDVASHPDFQGQGYASHLLRSTVHTLTEEGFDLAWLTGHSKFYRRFGWYECPGQFFEMTRISQFQPGPLPCTVRQLQMPDDYEAVRLVYDRFNENRTYTVHRTPAYWAWLDRYRPLWNHDRMIMFGARREGALVGYMLIEQHQSEWHLLEIGCLPPDTGEVATLVAAAGRMAVEANITRFRGVIPYDASSLVRLQQAGIEGRMLNSNPLFGNVMVQILHLSRFLQKIIPELQGRLRQTWQGSIAFNTERGDRAVLAVEGQIITVVESRAADVEITVSSDDLAHILLGYRSFSDVRRQKSPALSKQVRQLLSTLFPRTTPVFWGTDYV